MRVEIELTNGTYIVLPRNWDKVYNVREEISRSLKFCKHFPFMRFERRTYVSFRFMTEYETLTSYADPHYKANCNLKQFMHIFGINDVISFEQSLIESDLKSSV